MIVGLFDNAKSASAVEQIVLYALRYLQCLDDQNMTMDIAVNARIEANTGDDYRWDFENG
jgi:hypothetical protein